MKSKAQRFSREEWIKLLEDYTASGMSPKEYAQVKGTALSTLYKWSLQLKIPLLRGDKKDSNVESRTINLSSATCPKSKRSGYKKHDVFLPPPASDVSFIDITSQIRPESASFPQQVRQSLEDCGLEIQLPNGVKLKLEKVSFNHVWTQVIELVGARG